MQVKKCPTGPALVNLEEQHTLGPGHSHQVFPKEI